MTLNTVTYMRRTLSVPAKLAEHDTGTAAPYLCLKDTCGSNGSEYRH